MPIEVGKTTDERALASICLANHDFDRWVTVSPSGGVAIVRKIVANPDWIRHKISDPTTDDSAYFQKTIKRRPSSR